MQQAHDFYLPAPKLGSKGVEVEGEAACWIGKLLMFCDLIADGLWRVWRVCGRRMEELVAYDEIMAKGGNFFSSVMRSAVNTLNLRDIDTL